MKKKKKCVCVSSPQTHRMSPLHMLTTPAYITAKIDIGGMTKTAIKKYLKVVTDTNTPYFPLANESSLHMCTCPMPWLH